MTESPLIPVWDALEVPEVPAAEPADAGDDEGAAS